MGYIDMYLQSCLWTAGSVIKCDTPNNIANTIQVSKYSVVLRKSWQISRNQSLIYIALQHHHLWDEKENNTRNIYAVILYTIHNTLDIKDLEDTLPSFKAQGSRGHKTQTSIRNCKYANKSRDSISGITEVNDGLGQSYVIAL
jgi:hypothetical protein